MSNAINQSYANAATRPSNAKIYDPRARAGPSRQEFFGNPPTNASRFRYEILTLFTAKFNPDIIPSDDRPLAAMYWLQALKRHLASLNDIPVNQILAYIYRLLQGSAKSATFSLFQRQELKVEMFLNFFEDRYCGSAYVVSILNKLQKVKQNGSLQEYIAMHTQLQGYNEFAPVPVPDKVLKEAFISGLQNYALRRHLRTIRFSRVEIANGEEASEVVTEAERLVREGIFSEYGNAKIDVQMYQDLGSASVQDQQGLWNRNSAFAGFRPEHKPHVGQQKQQAMSSRTPFSRPMSFVANGPSSSDSGYHTRMQGQNGFQRQQRAQGPSYGFQGQNRDQGSIYLSAHRPTLPSGHRKPQGLQSGAGLGHANLDAVLRH